ncbi:MAG: hypothetical protein AAFQ64_04285 [Pseudomonadota bacterium]
MTEPENKSVDALLDEAASQMPEVPAHLMAAVMLDAARLQPTKAIVAPRPNLWDSFLDLIGGWPAMGGLAAAGLAGVWIGFAPPATLEAATAQILGSSQTIDLFGGDALSSFDVGEVAQ